MSFDPSNYSSNVVRWYPGAGYDGTTWTDAQGSGHNLTSATPPALVPTGFNVGPVARFNGSTSVLTASDAGLPTGDMTLIAVVKCTATTPNNGFQSIFSFGTEGGTLGREIGLGFQSNSVVGVDAAVFANWGTGSGVADQLNGWIVFQITRVGDIIRLRINKDGGQFFTNTQTINIVLNGTLIVGNLNTQNSPLTGDIQNIVVISEALSDATLLAIAEDIMSGVESPVTSYVTTSGNDGTAVRGNVAFPFATHDAALDASNSFALFKRSGGRDTISTGLGTFAPVTTAKTLSRVSITGTTRPAVDNSTTPTQLVGGSIIKGPFVWTDHSEVAMSGFGVDSGSVVCASDYGGTAQEGFQLSAGSAHIPVNLNLPKIGCSSNNIISLVKDATSLVHAFLVENQTGASHSNVDAYFGFAGIVTKLVNSTITNCFGHLQGSGGIYIKANAYANCHDNVYTNVGATGGAGLYFVTEDSGSEIYNITINGFTGNTCTFGINGINNGSGAGLFRDSTIASLAITNSGFSTLTNADNVALKGSISGSSGDGLVIDATCSNIHLGQSLVLNSNAGYGVNNLVDGTTGQNVTGSGNGSGLVGGFALVIIPPSSNLALGAGFFRLINPFT